MNSELNPTEMSQLSVLANCRCVVLGDEGLLAMRRQLHELANVFTGVMIAAGLLSQAADREAIRQYAANICEDSARGCVLVRELRMQLLTTVIGMEGCDEGGRSCGNTPGEDCRSNCGEV